MEQEIQELLKNEFPDVEFELETNNDHINTYDSLTLAGIIAVLSVNYDISIPFDEISEENFTSISAMASMVRRIQSKGK